jgi:transposase
MILHAYLDHEESRRWQCPICSREYCISDHVGERVWRDPDSGIYHVYLHARIPRVECPEHGKIQVSLPWADRHSRFFMIFETFALEIMKNMDIMNSATVLLLWRSSSVRNLKAVSNADTVIYAISRIICPTP